MIKFYSGDFSQKIINAYEKNIKHLPADKAAHFFSRAFKVSRLKKHENILAESFFKIKTLNIKKSLGAIKSGKFEYSPPAEIKSERQGERVCLYIKNPKLFFFDELLNDLFFIHKYNLEGIFLKKELREIYCFLKKQDFEKLYLKKENILKDNSYTINAIFYLKHLEICDFSEKALQIIKDLYFNEKMELDKKLEQYEFKSFIYSLTHIVIADSKYYSRNVKGYNWIVGYFINNLDFIMKNVTLDILAEVGLCIKIAQKEKQYSKEMIRIKKYIKKEFVLKKILREKNYLIKKEHTASIITMLFSGKKIFFEGPDLSKNRLMLNLINNEH